MQKTYGKKTEKALVNPFLQKLRPMCIMVPLNAMTGNKYSCG